MQGPNNALVSQEGCVSVIDFRSWIREHFKMVWWCKVLSTVLILMPSSDKLFPKVNESSYTGWVNEKVRFEMPSLSVKHTDKREVSDKTEHGRKIQAKGFIPYFIHLIQLLNQIWPQKLHTLTKRTYTHWVEQSRSLYGIRNVWFIWL